MSMLSLQTDHYRELAARSDDEKIKTALHQAAEAIEDLIFKHEALSCRGCKHDGQFENEYEYGYPCPCIRCKRKARDNYECKESLD